MRVLDHASLSAETIAGITRQLSAQENLKASMNQPEITGTQTREAGFTPTSPKIGGWLIVVAVGLIFSLLQNLTQMLPALAPLGGGPIWARLSDPDYSYWRTVIIYEAITAILVVVMNFVLIILFFGKKRLFPKLAVVFIPLIFILSFVAYYLESFIPALAEDPVFTKQGHALIVKFVALHIWIPYFLVSKRVRQTFVN